MSLVPDRSADLWRRCETGEFNPEGISELEKGGVLMALAENDREGQLHIAAFGGPASGLLRCVS
jgi:hypothetical protein